MDGNEANNDQVDQDLLSSGLEDNSDESGSVDQNPAGEGDSADDSNDGAGESVPSWHEQLKGNLKGDAALSKFEGVTSLAEAYIELEGKLGKSVSIPGDDASDEDKASFYGKLGRPEAADKYDLQYSENLPEYLKTALSGSEEKLKAQMFSDGLSQKQAAGVFDWIQKELYTGERLEAMAIQKQRIDGAATLKEEWGSDYEKNLNIMAQATRRFAGEDFIKAAREGGFANNPELIKMMFNIGKSISEDTLIEGSRKKPSYEKGLLDI